MTPKLDFKSYLLSKLLRISHTNFGVFIINLTLGLTAVQSTDSKGGSFLDEIRKGRPLKSVDESNRRVSKHLPPVKIEEGSLLDIMEKELEEMRKRGLGKFSNKISIIAIFGHKHFKEKIVNGYYKYFEIFHKRKNTFCL